MIDRVMEWLDRTWCLLLHPERWRVKGGTLCKSCGRAWKDKPW